jgi:hypothetical protein
MDFGFIVPAFAGFQEHKLEVTVRKILHIGVVALLLGWLFWGKAGFLIVFFPVLVICLVGLIASAALKNVDQKDCGKFTEALTKH